MTHGERYQPYTYWCNSWSTRKRHSNILGGVVTAQPEYELLHGKCKEKGTEGKKGGDEGRVRSDAPGAEGQQVQIGIEGED